MELLTEKCKEDFFNWALKQEYFGLCSNNKLRYEYAEGFGFEFTKMPLSMQWGVLVDFFDSFGFDVVSSEFQDVSIYGGHRKVVRVGILVFANRLYNKRHLKNIEVQHEEIKKDGK